MAAPAYPRQNASERLITFTIGATYWLWLIGGVYMAGPVLGWVLAYRAARAYYLAPALPAEERPDPLPLVLWAWLLCMLAMEGVLLAGHNHYTMAMHLGTADRRLETEIASFLGEHA